MGAAPKGEGVLTLRELEVAFEVVGGRVGGVPVVLTPGGGGGKGGFRWLAQRLRDGRQCLIWDRPNCGSSGLTLGDDVLQPEPDLQARAGRCGRARRRCVRLHAVALTRLLSPGGLPARAAAHAGHGARHPAGQEQRRAAVAHHGALQRSHGADGARARLAPQRAHAPRGRRPSTRRTCAGWCC
jgi:hypothetical protein